ncbi:MAG: type III secretion system export apparatus subunit SctR [Chlamydiota bacterium]
MNSKRWRTTKFALIFLVFLGSLWAFPIDILGQQAQGASEEVPSFMEQYKTFQAPSMVSQAVALSIMALFPFIIMILTAFIKIVVVLSLLRNALGAQQAPPNQILNGVGFLLSLYIMFPTAIQMYESAEGLLNSKEAPESFLASDSADYIIAVAGAASGPYRDYLKRNVIPAHRQSFYRMTYQILPDNYRANLSADDFVVLVPAYIASQLKLAFEVGVLIYIPFFVIDLVTANVLLAMGMMMLSPVTISMPLKLFLLVMVDGWTLLIQGLVTTFN